MKADNTEDMRLKHFPLDGVRKALIFAKEVANEDWLSLQKTNLKENSGYAPMQSIVNYIEKELMRMETFRNPPESVTLEIEILEKAFEPLMGLHSILSCAGGHSTDIYSGDVASVLGAVLHSAYTQTGYPSRGEIL